MNTNGFRTFKGASGINPGEYPVGSPESRAAARAMVAGRSKHDLSDYDRDALTIYWCSVFLTRVTPGYAELEGTAVYKHGAELRNALHGPIIPSHLDPKTGTRTFASIYFQLVHGRDSKTGDGLTYKELEQFCGTYYPQTIERFGKAWARRLPEMMFPLRMEDGKLYGRNSAGEWEEHTSIQASDRWASLETEVLALDVYRPNKQIRLLDAVAFGEMEKGKLKVQPVPAQQSS